MQPSAFYSQYLPYAQSVSQRTGLDPRLVLAQAALESGWGESAPSGNFFGIKSHGRPNGQTLVTSEYENGQYVPQEASFRTYAGPEQSFYDYGSFILDNPRYQPVMDAGDLQGQIAAMGASGYATDPEYSRKLSRIVGMFGGDGGNMQQPQQQQGLLGAAPQGNRRGDLAGAMAVAFNELRQRPSAAVPAMVEANRTRRAGNRTAEWLRGQPGGEEYAQMIDNGGNAAQVVAAFQASQKPDYVVVGNTLVDRKTGTEVYKSTAGFRPATTEEAAAYGANAGQIDASTGRFYPTTGGQGTLTRINPDTGEVEIVQGDISGLKLTEGQGKATGFYGRASNSQEILDKLDQEGTNLYNAAVSNIPIAGNYMTSPEYKLYDQAKRDFINAILRQESGAAIGKDEFANADIQYFPLPGDGPEVIAQKRRNREIAIMALKVASGQGAAAIETALDELGAGLKGEQQQTGDGSSGFTVEEW